MVLLYTLVPWRTFFLSLFPLFGCVWADGEKVARFIRKLPAKITVGIHYRLLIHRVAEEFMDWWFSGEEDGGNKAIKLINIIGELSKKSSGKVGLLNLSAWPPPPWSWDNQNQTRNWAHTYLFKSFDQTRPDQVCLCPAWWLFNKWNFITLKYVEKQNAILHKLRPNCAKLCKVKPSYYPSALLSVMY